MGRFVLSFLLSAAIHALAALILGLFMIEGAGGLVPEFASGLSSVELTLAPMSDADQPTPNVPAAPDNGVPALIDEPEPATKETQPALNADPVEKGVVNPVAEGGVLHPFYPLSSRMRGEEGTVTLKITVNPLGRADSCEIISSSGFPALDRAAVDSAKKARFVNPAQGRPAGGTTTISFRFKLVD